jgi:hypothetical protein
MWIAVFSVALALAICCGVAATLLARPLHPIGNGRNA